MKKLTWLTKKGVGEPMPLTDLQVYNRRTNISLGLAIFWSLVGLWIIYYVMKHNVLNNIVAKCI